MYLWNWEKLRKHWLINIKIWDRWKCIPFCFCFIICFMYFRYHVYLRTVLFWWSEKSNFKQKYLLESIKRRTKVHEKNVSPERALNFDQSKSFSQWDMVAEMLHKEFLCDIKIYLYLVKKNCIQLFNEKCFYDIKMYYLFKQNKFLFKKIDLYDIKMYFHSIKVNLYSKRNITECFFHQIIIFFFIYEFFIWFFCSDHTLLAKKNR